MASTFNKLDTLTEHNFYHELLHAAAHVRNRHTRRALLQLLTSVRIAIALGDREEVVSQLQQANLDNPSIKNVVRNFLGVVADNNWASPRQSFIKRNDPLISFFTENPSYQSLLEKAVNSKNAAKRQILVELIVNISAAVAKNDTAEIMRQINLAAKLPAVSQSKKTRAWILNLKQEAEFAIHQAAQQAYKEEERADESDLAIEKKSVTYGEMLKEFPHMETNEKMLVADWFAFKQAGVLSQMKSQVSSSTLLFEQHKPCIVVLTYNLSEGENALLKFEAECKLIPTKFTEAERVFVTLLPITTAGSAPSVEETKHLTMLQAVLKKEGIVDYTAEVNKEMTDPFMNSLTAKALEKNHEMDLRKKTAATKPAVPVPPVEKSQHTLQKFFNRMVLGSLRKESTEPKNPLPSPKIGR